MYRMKDVFLSLTMFLILINCFSQKKETVTLFFDLGNNEIVEINQDRVAKKVKKFFKNEKAFYIERQQFKIKSKIGQISVETNAKIKYSNLTYLMNKWEESQLVSSLEVFEEIYIIEEVNGEYYKYKVEWNGNKSFKISK